MPLYTLIGRNRSDFAATVDFGQSRAVMRINTAAVVPKGLYLEIIPAGVNGLKPGMMLMNADWRHNYFLRERENWKDDDYFDAAENIFEQKGIRP